MCRALMYLGEQTLVDDFLNKTDSSLIKQTYQPRYMSIFDNLAGFGMAAWDPNSLDAHLPFLYRTKYLPFYDQNLKHLSLKTSATCLLAHVRGTVLSTNSVLSEQNVHPFMYDGFQYALAHNGQLSRIEDMKYDLIAKMKPDIAMQIKGTTDTELVYALLMSQLDNPFISYPLEEMMTKVIDTIKIIHEVRASKKIDQASALNLFITNGSYVIATRFSFNFGHFLEDVSADLFNFHSLWFTLGERYGFYDHEFKMKFGKVNRSIIISSEPLTKDATTWFEVPEYFILGAQIEHDQLRICKKYIDI